MVGFSTGMAHIDMDFLVVVVYRILHLKVKDREDINLGVTFHMC